MFPHKPHWMKHMAMAPKGFLRYRVLKLLNEKPFSGSEIMSEIEKQTDGHWIPSPGSIYPLLAWLLEKGYIKEVAEQNTEMKRYTLTEKGNALLQEHIKTYEELRERFRHFRPGPGFMGPMGFGFYPEEAKELRKATRDLAIALWNLNDRLRRKYDEKVAKEATKALEEATVMVEEITKKLKG